MIYNSKFFICGERDIILPLSDFLSCGEINFCNNFSGARKSEWLAGRLAVKKAVNFYCKNKSGLDIGLKDIEIISTKKRKPFCVIRDFDSLSFGLDINISHTQGIAVGAVSSLQEEGMVGIDIEIIRNFRQDMLKSFLAEDELEQIGYLIKNGYDIAVLNTLFWSIKEAFLKAIGVGLFCHMKDVRIKFNGGNIVLFFKKQEVAVSEKHYLGKNYIISKINIPVVNFLEYGKRIAESRISVNCGQS